MTRLRGRAPCGERVVEHAPHGHWHTTTMISAIRLTGVEAPMVIDGAMDSLVFRGYIERMPAPALHAGDIVVMDNLSSHTTAGVREAIEAVDASLLYLPPYSPDFNPIESMWSKATRSLRGPPGEPAERYSSRSAMRYALLRSKIAEDSSKDADIPLHNK